VVDVTGKVDDRLLGLVAFVVVVVVVVGIVVVVDAVVVTAGIVAVVSVVRVVIVDVVVAAVVVEVLDVVVVVKSTEPHYIWMYSTYVTVHGRMYRAGKHKLLNFGLRTLSRMPPPDI